MITASLYNLLLGCLGIITFFPGENFSRKTYITRENSNMRQALQTKQSS